MRKTTSLILGLLLSACASGSPQQQYAVNPSQQMLSVGQTLIWADQGFQPFPLAPQLQGQVICTQRRVGNTVQTRCQ